MALLVSGPASTSVMEGLRDHLAGGTLEIQAADNTVLVTYTLTSGGGSVSSGVWTVALEAVTVAASAAGTATKGLIKNSGGVIGINGFTVGESGTDIIIDDATIDLAQNITIATLQINHD